MSDVSLTKTTIKTARPLEPWSDSVVLSKAKKISDTDCFGLVDTAIRRREEIGPIFIRIEATKPVAAAALWFGLHGSASFAGAMMQLAAHEAPAWAVSMVVHMVTLVTMAMVTVPAPVTYKAKHLVVTTPVEEKIEAIKDSSSSEQPNTLDDDVTVESVAIDSAVDHGSLEIKASNEEDAAPAAVDLTDIGLDQMPKSDMLTIVGAYGGTGLSGRGLATKAKLAMSEGGSDTSEKSVNAALRWLSNHQMPDGGWSYNHSSSTSCRGQCRNPGSMGDARNAATAMALLPFLGTGQTHKDGPHRATIRRGLAFLTGRMRVGVQGGALNENRGNMYSHGLASIALCEAYAMTEDPELAGPAQASMNFICFAQDPVGGGWRYTPRQPGDTSIVGWQLMALKSGYMANLTIAPQTIHRATLFLDSVQIKEGAAYGYLHASGGSDATSAIGILCRMYTGWKKDNPALQRGVKLLAGRGPSGVDMYYNYYATQVMRHWEGDEWKTWNRQMRDQLIHSQAKQGHEEGSWFTGGGDHGAKPGGRLYCTAMATMILEVYYRHLPLYRPQSVDQDFPD